MEWSSLYRLSQDRLSQAFAGLIVPCAFNGASSRLNPLQMWHACTQRFIRRRYMGPDYAASAMGATHDKLTSSHPRGGLRAFATRVTLCLSPASNGSKRSGLS
jgi:hypothetical protein